MLFLKTFKICIDSKVSIIFFTQPNVFKGEATIECEKSGSD